MWTREHLGLTVPVMHCPFCRAGVVILICWDSERDRIVCGRCAMVRSKTPGGRGRFLALSIDARGRGIEHLPASRAIAVLIRHGASPAI
jgi:ribosomal protein S27AE